MQRARIEIGGETEADLAAAADEAAKLIREGFTSGRNENESGWFSFATGDEADFC